MLQEEALIIADRLGVSDFTASNGWLQCFKQNYNLQRMATAGEDGDVSSETLESWNEREREITRGWKPDDVWNMDETGSFWKGLPDTSLNEKGKRCKGGKQAKQRNTWAFFVNAAGEKMDPIVIGNAKKPRCFRNMSNIQRPYGCYYYSNQKAWMKTEIMEDILKGWNERLKKRKQTILLFLDNAPCHPQGLVGQFSNITIKFLSKNTTSKTQPLDAGIIANWKIKYKRLLRYVCSKVDTERSASDIVKSINVGMAIQWGKEAWNEVSPETIVKCFKKAKLYPQEAVDEDDPFEGEDELPALQKLIDKCRVDSSCDAGAFIAQEEGLAVCPGLVDQCDSNWRSDIRNIILDSDSDTVDNAETDMEDEFDPEPNLPALKNTSEAQEVAQQIKEFAQFHGYESLSLATSKVADMLEEIRMSSPKSQTTITDFFS